MDGRDDEMSGHRRTHRDLSGLTVTDLADTNDIRVLSQDGTKTGGKGKTDLFINLYLGCTLHVVLDRILQGDEVRVFGKKLIHKRIHRGRFTRTCRTYDHDDAGR